MTSDLDLSGDLDVVPDLRNRLGSLWHRLDLLGFGSGVLLVMLLSPEADNRIPRLNFWGLHAILSGPPSITVGGMTLSAAALGLALDSLTSRTLRRAAIGLALVGLVNGVVLWYANLIMGSQLAHMPATLALGLLVSLLLAPVVLVIARGGRGEGVARRASLVGEAELRAVRVATAGVLGTLATAVALTRGALDFWGIGVLGLVAVITLRSALAALRDDVRALRAMTASSRRATSSLASAPPTAIPPLDLGIGYEERAELTQVHDVYRDQPRVLAWIRGDHQASQRMLVKLVTRDAVIASIGVVLVALLVARAL